MTEHDQNEKSKTMATEWFKDHVATATNFSAAQGDGVMIHWRKPNDGCYSITFTIFNNYVVVTGDVGDAIYGFGNIDLEKLASFDWHYFINKCCASETGRHYTMKVAGIKHPVPNIRAIAHFIGLQMALKQLRGLVK